MEILLDLKEKGGDKMSFYEWDPNMDIVEELAIAPGHVTDIPTTQYPIDNN